MTLFLYNVLLAGVWAAATGNIALDNLFAGWVISYVVLWWFQPVLGPSEYFRKLPLALALTGFFVWELICSTLLVAWEVLTPTTYRRPGIIAVPLDAKTDGEITLLAILITLTPGSLTLDVSDDRTVMYVHIMFVENPAATRRSLKRGFERLVLALLR